MLKYILYISTLIIFVNAKTCHIGFTCSENECVSTKDSRRQAWEHYQCSNELHCQSAKCKYLVDKEGYEQMMKEDSATCTLHYDLTTIKKKCPTSSFDCTSNHNIDKNLDWIGKDTYLIQLGDTLDGKRPETAIDSAFLEESGEIEIIRLILNLDAQARTKNSRVISFSTSY